MCGDKFVIIGCSLQLHVEKFIRHYVLVYTRNCRELGSVWISSVAKQSIVHYCDGDCVKAIGCT